MIRQGFVVLPAVLACLLLVGCPDHSAGGPDAGARSDSTADGGRDGQVVVGDGGATDGATDGATPPVCSLVNLADFLPGAASDTAAITAALAATVPGDTLWIPAGHYVIDDTLKLTDDVKLAGDPLDPPVLEGASDELVVITHDVDAPLHNVTLEHLRFQNVGFRLYGNGSYSVISNITFRYCEFFDGKESEGWAALYISVPYADHVVVDRCTFLRRSEAYGGRGVNFWRSHHGVVKDSFFGTTRHLEPAAEHGYFSTAINVNGGSEDLTLRPEGIVLQGNVARRVSSPTCPYVGTGDLCQDHGYYVHAFNGLDLVGNRIDGWDQTGSGGALKLRNAENARVIGNSFATSGVLLYTYEGHPVTYLRRVAVHANHIDLGLGSQACATAYCGINYWRNYGAAAATGHEEDIHLTWNRFADGGLIRLSNAWLDGFCVEGNLGDDPLESAGCAGTLDDAGCLPQADWFIHPLGLFSGDFNGDGGEDFVFFDKHHAQSPRWVGHMSACQGHHIEDWGLHAGFSAQTPLYPVPAADFTGDGLTDVVIRGQCGADDHPCWRLLASTGSVLTPSDAGDGARFTDETLIYGVLVGDFDGNGRSDFAYRGLCGTDAHPCWRVHVSSGGSFAAQDWGDGAYFGPDSPRWGLVVADVTGDGRDDIVARGRCGGDAHPCWRVHVSSGSSFTAQDWGDDLYLADDSIHLGLHTGDINGDGRADLGYRGRCGQSVPRWRYHVSTGNGFTVQCADERLF